jgi:putative ABC transport system permease protein
MSDFKYALRTLARAPGLTIIAGLVVAFSLGLATAATGLAYEIFLRPLPFHADDRLAIYCCPFPEQGQGWRDAPGSPAAMRDYERAARSVDEVAIFYDQQSLNLTGNASSAGSDHVPVTFVSGNYFPLLGTAPARGRYFTPEECHEGTAYPLAIASHAFWKNHLGGRADTVGAVIQLNGRSYTIIGIMPEAFRDLSSDNGSPQLWLPMPMAMPFLGENFLSSYSLRTFRAAVRLKSGVSFAVAQQEADTIARQITQAQPKTHYGRTIRLMPVREFFFLNTRQPVIVLFGGALLVLLLGAVNLANLFALDGLRRAHEFALRAALGADSRRLARTVLTQASVPLALGGLAGLGLAAALISLFNRVATLTLHDFAHVRLSPWVIVAALVLLCLVISAAVLTVVLRARRFDLRSALQAGSKSMAAAGSVRSRYLLIAVEVALATALLVGTGLTARSLFQMMRLETGYKPDRLLTFQLQLDPSHLPTREQRIGFARQLTEALQNGPGVETAVLWGPSMLGHAGWTLDVTPAGRDLSNPASALNVQYLETIPGALAGLGIPLLRGRDFSSGAVPEFPVEAVIDEEAARRLWPGADPIGQTMYRSNNPAWPMTVIGLVPHVLNRGRIFNDTKYLTGDVYTSFYQVAQERITVLIRYRTGKDGTVFAWARAQLSRLDPNLAPFDIASMEDRLVREGQGPRFTATIFGVYAVISLLVTVVGIYGVLAFSIAQRVREFGIRFAIGASRTQVLGLVLRQSLRWIVTGVAAGLIFALEGGSLLEDLLIGVSPRDPSVLAGTVVVILAASLLATLVPAIRATRVDPIVALRYE